MRTIDQPISLTLELVYELVPIWIWVQQCAGTVRNCIMITQEIMVGEHIKYLYKIYFDFEQENWELQFKK